MPNDELTNDWAAPTRIYVYGSQILVTAQNIIKQYSENPKGCKSLEEFADLCKVSFPVSKTNHLAQKKDGGFLEIAGPRREIEETT